MSEIGQLLRKHASKICLAAAIVILSIHMFQFWPAFIDDVYISYRYSRNLVDGIGYVYNPGERVEGCSSFFWTLWVALGMKLGADPLLFSKISGALLGVATLIYLSRRIHPLVALGAACSGVFAYWLVTGIETPLLMFFMAIALGELYRKNLNVSAIFFGLLPLVRPDGLYFSVLIFLPTIALYWRDSNLSIKKVIPLLGYVVVPYLFLMLWRYSYFGNFQPNTYYSKFAMPWYDGFWLQLEQQGIPYVTGFWKTFPALFALWIFSLGFAILRRQKFLLILHAALIMYQCYFVYIGGDWMPLFRWYAALIPLLLAMALPAFNKWQTPKFERWRLQAAALVVAVICGTFLYNSFVDVLGTGVLRYYDKHDVFFQALGRELKTDKPFAERIMLGDIGAVGYESNLYVSDGGALVDAHLAHMPTIHFWKSDLRYLLKQDNEWVGLRLHFFHHPADEATARQFKQAIGAQPQKMEFTPELWMKLAPSGRWVFEQQLLGSAEFHSRYSAVFVMPEFDQPQYFLLFCRKDICGSERAIKLRNWAPNLGHVKLDLQLPDADAYLKKTFEVIPGEETALVAYSRRNHDRDALRRVALNWKAMRANRLDAYTALGLEEYGAKEFALAADDFKKAVALGGNSSMYYSNVGWAYKAMGQADEAQRWFEKGK